ncbi:hypothetical protein CVT26_012815 [Gymnopilus dilepis]|uniref:Uncharacterized protein n=1 Tax=Gymnopilus dilepis TaxID=231916 RepID=A0A409WDG9_9AGAR|nr:hypothetical protein CVT26_012815 [Gymnopilus dilepis]
MTFGRDGPYLTGHRYGRSAPAQHQDAGSHHHSTTQCPLLKDISTSALNSLLPSYNAAHISVSLQGDKPKLVESPQESSDQAPEGKKARLDVEALLNDLAFITKRIREDFQIHSHICKASWFLRVKLQHGFIDSALKESGNASSLLENPALALCYFPPDLPLSLVELHHITRIQKILNALKLSA